MFNKNLITYRKRKGYTQEELAARINVVRQTVSKWEKGLSVPDAEMLIKLADVLEVSVSQLLGAPEPMDAHMEPIAEQLSRINEQLAIKNRRARRIWKTVGIVVLAVFVLNLLITVLGFAAYSVVTPGATYAEESVINEEEMG